MIPVFFYTFEVCSESTTIRFIKHFILLYLIFQEAVLHLIQPILLGYVLRYFANPQEDFRFACICAGGVCGASILFITVHHPTSLFVLKMAMKCRVAWSTLMYKKVSIKLTFHTKLILIQN